jgi:hypothetical protein
MVLPVGKPCGRVGFVSTPCLRAFIWLFISVCKLCIKDRPEGRGFTGRFDNTRPLHIALTTCDNIFDAGGVGTSIVRIARGLSTHYNAQVDILMLNLSERVDFNLRGRIGTAVPFAPLQ